MERTRRAADWKTVFPICLLTAAVFLFLCTKSSPLYPLNEWVDANIYFTIGKGMMHGLVPYLNLYDQKGPVAFLIYGLASLISGTSFFGVYIIEVIAFSFFLFASYRIVALYTEKFALIVLPVFAAFILGSLSFSHGGSLEELMMPLFAWSLYDMLRYFKQDYPNPVPLGMIARSALFAGIMLLGKFTLLAFYVVWMGMLALSQLTAKHVKRAFSASGLFLLVMLAVGIPFVVYFALNGALKDFFYYYFYSNVFNYAWTEHVSMFDKLFIIIKSVGAFSYRNPQIALLIALGLGWLLLQKRESVRWIEKISVLLMAGLLACAIYIGGQGYRYYGLVLTPFMALGMIPIVRLLERREYLVADKPWFKRTMFIGTSIVMIGLALLISDNRYMLSIPREETPQAHFAAIMEEKKTEENVTLLCYAMPDAGFYLAVDEIPPYRFFARVNVDLPELKQAQNDYIAEKSAEFIVTRNLEISPDGYTLIETQTFWSEEQNDTFRLYQRVS